MELRSSHCIVRTYRSGDAESLARNGNNRKIWLNLRDLFPHPYTQADGEAYIARVLSGEQPTSYAIEVDGHAIGGVGLRIGHDVERLTAEMGYWIGEEYWGRGIVSAAIELITPFAFTELGLVRIFALPFARNVPSCRVLEKAGYVREGLLRCNSIKDGALEDQYMYAAISPRVVGG
jgi:RimJ/RimL family protein N-acetyltransferase